MDTIFEGKVEKLAFGGQGIIRSNGLVVFVPYTVPGDQILYKITLQKKRYAFGELFEILAKSSLRVSPKCPYFGTCGGCQLQHLNQEAQLDYKRESVTDALQRIGRLHHETVKPTIPAQPWGYRRHITLTLKPSDGQFEAGYIAIDHRTVIKIDYCPIFLEDSTSIIDQVQRICSRLRSSHDNEGKVSIFKAENGQFILYFKLDSLSPDSLSVLKNSINSTCIGILLTTPQQQFSWGKVEGIIEIEGMKFQFSPKVFIQNHPEQSLNIYHQILTIAHASVAQRALDLYCGIGISSMLLTRERLQVIGVESNPHAVNYAKMNAKINEMGDLNFIQADVKEVLPSLLTKFNPEFVILNPPRTGLDPGVTRALLDKPPRSIAYISCMPSTLARDLHILCTKGSYKLKFVQPYDMFPQTAHVEVLALLE